jgi:hypothetical protein
MKMQVNYQLNTTQLDIDFIESIKLLFGDKKIDIVIRDELSTQVDERKIPNLETLNAMREVEEKQTQKVTLDQLKEEAKQCLN